MGIVQPSMPAQLFRPEEVRALLAEGAQLVDVLPREEYEEQHLPGAIGIRLREVDGRARSELDAGRPVVVYCWDSA
jgi:rhodanese-related sulfurtransferase